MFDWTRTSQSCLEEFWEGLVEIAQINSIMCNQRICYDWQNVPVWMDDKGWWLHGWIFLSVYDAGQPFEWVCAWIMEETWLLWQNDDFGAKTSSAPHWLVCSVTCSFLRLFWKSNYCNKDEVVFWSCAELNIAWHIFFASNIVNRRPIFASGTKQMFYESVWHTDIVRWWREYMSVHTGKFLTAQPSHKSNLHKQTIFISASKLLTVRCVCVGPILTI